MSFSIITTDWLSQQGALKFIREQVFIAEQAVPLALEWDGLDEAARHWLAVDKKHHPIGCARLLSTGQIGRMAVLKPWRGQGVGRALLTAILSASTAQNGVKLFLHAQTDAIDFYLAFGFNARGSVFYEADIPHIYMESSA
ncbi:GNAT family N-acetyltransferase [Candidatus Venteria ishoeyi]|uniref:Putative N-acetyltransferase YjcF n=1 Tax=Candidatus Venteria ishoeyi TaxID=1899563 RepID=A0A1H6F708_9GAMM|nr:GNAT family N-acetyltransferase [Candidatus Venteria ishoeyi]SEH04856.1 putative N-acetyltransferase YjcF [Candidatus Venteria ishoeyi]